MVWIAESQSWLERIFRGTAASSTASFPIVCSIAHAVMHFGTSQIPVGLTPGHLSREVRQQATKTLLLFGLTIQEHKGHPIVARTEHKTWDTNPKEKQSELDEPANPGVCKAARWIEPAFKFSELKSWVQGSYWASTMVWEDFQVCLSWRTSWIDWNSVWSSWNHASRFQSVDM